MPHMLIQVFYQSLIEKMELFLELNFLTFLVERAELLGYNIVFRTAYRMQQTNGYLNCYSHATYLFILKEYQSTGVWHILLHPPH